MLKPSFELRDEGEGPVQVVVCDGYAYAWPYPDDPLVLGEKVVGPGGPWGKHHTKVQAFGSFYEGKLTRLLCRERDYHKIYTNT